MREKKIKRKRGRIYCIYEGLTGGKLRKNLMFHMYTPLSINTLVQDRIKKKKKKKKKGRMFPKPEGTGPESSKGETGGGGASLHMILAKS